MSASSRKTAAPATAARSGGATRIAVERTLGETKRAVAAGLRVYNRSRLGPFKGESLAVSLRDDRGAIVGGLFGEIWLDWLHIDRLWIDESQRGAGIGAQLLATAEAEARRRGARHVHLDSFTFQAPDFYKKLGYREFGRLADFPTGHERVFLTKAL